MSPPSRRCGPRQPRPSQTIPRPSRCVTTRERDHIVADCRKRQPRRRAGRHAVIQQGPLSSSPGPGIGPPFSAVDQDPRILGVEHHADALAHPWTGIRRGAPTPGDAIPLPDAVRPKQHRAPTARIKHHRRLVGGHRPHRRCPIAPRLPIPFPGVRGKLRSRARAGKRRGQRTAEQDGDSPQPVVCHDVPAAWRGCVGRRSRLPERAIEFPRIAQRIRREGSVIDAPKEHDTVATAVVCDRMAMATTRASRPLQPRPGTVPRPCVLAGEQHAPASPCVVDESRRLVGRRSQVASQRTRAADLPRRPAGTIPLFDARVTIEDGALP